MCGNMNQDVMFRRILVGVDKSKQAEWATEVAGQLASAVGARIALVHTYRVDPGYSPELAMPIEDLLLELRDSGLNILKVHRRMLPSSLEVEEMLIEGDAASQIVAAADSWHADLILMGTHGRGRLAQFLVGSTAESVIRMARCPVMTVAHEPRKHVDSTCCGTAAIKEKKRTPEAEEVPAR